MDPPAVPYAAYKSKRQHARASSNPQLARASSNPQLANPASPPPPRSRPTSLLTASAPVVPNWTDAQAANGSDNGAPSASDVGAVAATPDAQPPSPTTTTAGAMNGNGTVSQAASPANGGSDASSPLSSPPATPPSPVPAPIPAIKEPSEAPVAGPSTASPVPPKPAPTTRKSSTFRRLPLRPANSRSPLPSSPLRPGATSTPSHSRTPSCASQPDTAPPTPQNDRVLLPIPPAEALRHPVPSRPAEHSVDLTPPPRSTSLPPHAPSPALSSTASRTSSPAVPPQPQPVPAAYTPRSTPAPPTPTPSPRPAALYRPGFQPKGVYRPRTDEFLQLRTAARAAGRIERTRLARRLEKLIQLHFPPPARDKGKEEDKRPLPAKRASSFFDLDLTDLRRMAAGELWKGVVQGQAQAHGGKTDIRAAEQKITPWQDDAEVSACPLCSTSFHPLTNRKHHCRLCGRVVCSLPRAPPCSLLFVVSDGRIEEVGEGVDYGVRRRTAGAGQGMDEAEKFLKGVRICRECRPVLMQQQYQQEVRQVPVFARLYEAFISLEKDIEETLPQFQELLVTLSNDEQPTKEASAIRRHLLDSFAQYDALAKRIRKLPCAKGSSQERVQAAVSARANLFLQQHMLPLQSLSRPRHKPESATSTGASSPVSERDAPAVDPDSALARRLQPLLEQEALLETFVAEALARRKFEDARTLKLNLREIRAEIERMLAAGGRSGNAGGIPSS